ncbi:MAG: rod shape-determining protein MreD [Thermoleophilia bacterium]|nr:rod shape-determining protein MreD [Thermoleophilia bacterium]
MIRGVVLALVLLVVATVQVSVLGGVSMLGAEPDLLLVTLVAVALQRGVVVGAVAGFGVGLLVDVMTLGTPGLTSLVLTLAGTWAGRYGETTGRGRAHAPALAAAALTVLVLLGGGVLQALIGEPVSAGSLLRTVIPSALLAALLAAPVNRTLLVLLGRRAEFGRVHEIEHVG